MEEDHPSDGREAQIIQKIKDHILEASPPAPPRIGRGGPTPIGDWATITETRPSFLLHWGGRPLRFHRGPWTEMWRPTVGTMYGEMASDDTDDASQMDNGK